MPDPNIRERLVKMKKEAKRYGQGPIYLFLNPDAEAEIEAANPDIWGIVLGEKISKLGARAAFGSELLGMRVIWDQHRFEAKRDISRDEEDRYRKQLSEAKEKTDGTV
jgi:hypothetical protein